MSYVDDLKKRLEAARADTQDGYASPLAIIDIANLLAEREVLRNALSNVNFNFNFNEEFPVYGKIIWLNERELKEGREALAWEPEK